MNRESDIHAALLISGEGTTAEAVIHACQRGEIKGIEPAVVVSSRLNAQGLDRARALDIPTEVVERNGFVNREAFGEAILAVLKTYGVDLISQNGWMPLTPTNVIEAYSERIINQHPGPLDPGSVDFGGKGMFGVRVTCARLAYCWSSGDEHWTESTVHHVNGHYDTGKLISVVPFGFPHVINGPVTIEQHEKSPGHLRQKSEDVQRKLLPFEHGNVIAALAAFGERGEFPRFTRSNPLIPEERKQIAVQAKRLAVQLYP